MGTTVLKVRKKQYTLLFSDLNLYSHDINCHHRFKGYKFLNAVVRHAHM